jgi:RNA polymerase sigma-70 factor (ECF subfamily)
MSVLEEPSVPDQAYLDEPSFDSFETFFRREYKPMVALAAAVSGSPEGAEDIAQEAMVRARRHWDRIRSYDKPGTWVRRVTINLAISSRRRLALEARARLAWWERRDPTDDQQHQQPPAFDPDLLGALRALSPQQRAAISLHYLEDRSTSDIADLLGCSESTARVHLHRGRLALAQHLGATR